MIKAICFDLDGVYFTSAGVNTFKQALVDLGVTPQDVEYMLYGKPMKEFKRGEIEEGAFWKNAVEYWKLDKSPQEIIDLLTLGYEIDPEVGELVKKVRDNGYKTCICSNNYVTRINALEKKFNFLDNFDSYVFSYEIGIIKPDKGIFEELVKRTGVKPSELVYSDDGEDKLKGALEIGINAFLYENFEQFKDKLIELGVKI